jgi:hypothetical protein
MTEDGMFDAREEAELRRFTPLRRRLGTKRAKGPDPNAEKHTFKAELARSVNGTRMVTTRRKVRVERIPEWGVARRMSLWRAGCGWD